MRERGLTEAEKKAQGERCGCHGSDDYCPCQNVPDAVTRQEWGLPPTVSEYDRGRRDLLNALLAPNERAAQKRHIINGGTEHTFTNHQGQLPFDVVFWVCEVASQLGIKSRDELADEPALALPRQEQEPKP